MKRMNKTAIALATAGALGFGITPMADAQAAKTETGTPAANDVNNIDPNGNPYPDATEPLPSGLTEQPGETRKAGDKREEGTPAANDVNNIDPNGNPYPDATEPLPSGLTEQPGPTFKNNHVITKEKNGETLVLFEDNNGVQFYLPVNAEGKPVRDGKVVEGLRPATVERKPGETTEKDALPVVLGVLGGLAGLGLVIAGVNYWVNKDGNLVTDPNKVNEPSTAADAENTKKIVGENTDEVAKQLGIDPVTGQPVNGGERGIGASTGVNKIPAALLSLLLASVLGAAAFVFGRRQLV